MSTSNNQDTDDRSTVSKQRAQYCLREIIRYYHEQVDADLPSSSSFDTPQAYFEGRGWNDDTIQAYRLGYAPSGKQTGLLNRLIDCGFTRDEILATGLFRERLTQSNLHPVWKGRYVIPYLNEDGAPVFAISRRIGEDGHEADTAGMNGSDTPSKYHKIPVSLDHVVIEEPIFGLDSLEPGAPVVITEGIADAITAHQHRYPAISPVTTQFKTSDRDRIAGILDEYGVQQAFVINDSEQPAASVVEYDDGSEALYTEAFGPGVRGAVKTAERLVAGDDDGIDARVGELPQPGVEKVDLDDYLNEWDGDLTAVIRSAKPPRQHPAASSEKQSKNDAATQSKENTPEKHSDTEKSALFELDITDVTGFNEGSRGKNPLGHHGTSEDYFTIFEHEGEMIAYDHKHKTAYTALTYLLCEADERHASQPGGTITDEDIWVAWKYAKEEEYVSSDDSVPTRALKHIAADHDLCDESELIDGWKLPEDAYADALEIIENTYDLEPGRSVPKDPATAIPYERLQALSWDEARRFARKRGIEWPSTSEVRDRLQSQIVTAFEQEEATVIDAPTAAGKSHTVASEPWRNRVKATGGEPVIHLHATRKSRDEAFQASQAAGLKAKKVLGRREACPVAAGDHDDEISIDGAAPSQWLDVQCDSKAVPFSVAHSILAHHNDQDAELPCSPGDSKCPAKAQWEDIPRDDEEGTKYDVIHATYHMSFVPSLLDDTNVVIDELPDFSQDLGMPRIRRAVTAYLDEIGAPVTTWEAFIHLTRLDDELADAGLDMAMSDTYIDLRDCIAEESPPLSWYVENEDAHVLTRAIIECIIDAHKDDSDENGLRTGETTFRVPRLDERSRVSVTVVIDEDNNVRSVRQTPDLTRPRSVVGLDAHPSMPLWQLNTLPTITRTQIFSSEERARWRVFERGLFVVQVGDATRPLSGDKASEWFGEERVKHVVEPLVERGLSTGITTAQVEHELADVLDDTGATDIETMHYGNVRSRNDFAGESIGFVNGAMDPGDEYVLTVLAEYGCEATPETVTDDDGDEKRAHGRGFEGPDADIANEILASVRENQVAQAAGRYARNPDDPDDRATVYVRTDALPPGFADVQVKGVTWVATDKQRRIIETLQSQRSATAKEIAGELGDVTKRHVLKTLRRLRENGIVDCRKAAGDWGADLYQSIAGTTSAITDLSSPRITNGDVKDSSTWSFVILDGGTVGNSQDGDESVSVMDILRPGGGDSPIKVAAQSDSSGRSDQLGGEPGGGHE